MAWHVDNDTGVLVKPAKQPVFSSYRRYFIDALGQTPTIPQADWFNMVDGEIHSLAEALGVTPDKNDDQQLGKALAVVLSSINKIPFDLQEALGVFWEYRPDYHYRPFDRVIFRNGMNREVYQVYHPDGCINLDPRDAVNRPTGWTETDPSKPYHWLKLPANGERGQIGTVRIAMSHLRQENELVFVGGSFDIRAGVIPWLYKAIKGALPNNAAENFTYGMREDDFMRFISSNNIRTLLSQEAHAIANHFHYYREHGNVQLIGHGPGGQVSSLTDQTDQERATQGPSGNVANETRPVNTALTAFITI